jgi:hypothetical protein
MNADESIANKKIPVTFVALDEPWRDACEEPIQHFTDVCTLNPTYHIAERSFAL